MIVTYRSLHANETHQLSVTVSKHFFATKDGRLTRQQKPLEVQLRDVHDSKKNHLVHYVLRDHFSGLFYYEFSLAMNLMPVAEFLHRAWSVKSDFPLHGMPHCLSIPGMVRTVFPTIVEQVSRLGIEVIDATSGFQSGIRDIQTIESSLVGPLVAGMIGETSSSVEAAAQYMRRLHVLKAGERSRNRVESKKELWERSAATVGIRLPPDGWTSNA